VASIGHVVLGTAVARFHDGKLNWRSAIAFSTFSMMPDLDVIAFRFGIPYSAPFGHRGATHSIAFALLVGLFGWLLTKRWRSTLAVAFVVLSHPLLDALTDGGLGVALFWPLTNHRYFFPWNPLPVAPIGKGMLSLRGLYVIGVESLVFLPLLFLPLPAKRGEGRGEGPSRAQPR
jgi:inner membrane protein